MSPLGTITNLPSYKLKAIIIVTNNGMVPWTKSLDHGENRRKNVIEIILVLNRNEFASVLAEPGNTIFSNDIRQR